MISTPVDVYKRQEQGSDYTSKDVFDKSCLDYMKEYSWRNGVLEIVEEVERK